MWLLWLVPYSFCLRKDLIALWGAFLRYAFGYAVFVSCCRQYFAVSSAFVAQHFISACLLRFWLCVFLSQVFFGFGGGLRLGFWITAAAISFRILNLGNLNGFDVCICPCPNLATRIVLHP